MTSAPPFRNTSEAAPRSSFESFSFSIHDDSCNSCLTRFLSMKMNRLIPMLPVKSMPASVDFYCRMLGFEVERRRDEWGWAMLRFDECRLMVDQSINANPGKLRDSILYLYPDDVVEYHQRVRK